MLENKEQSAANIHGVGVGLRPQHFKEVLEQKPIINWFEALADNFLHCSGPAFYHLCEIAEQYPVTLHSVGLAIGSVDPVDNEYLKQLKNLANAINAPLLSDHLCWTKAHGHNLHELIPLPYTQSNLNWIVDKVRQCQDTLQQPIMLENVSRYVSYKHNDMSESEFLSTLSQQTGCGILLDVNNLYVNQFNHDDDPLQFFETLSSNEVWQMHLAGYTNKGTYLLDSHAERVHSPVWELYELAIKAFPKTPTLIEWDHDIPALPILLEEAAYAQTLFDKANHGTIVIS